MASGEDPRSFSKGMQVTDLQEKQTAGDLDSDCEAEEQISDMAEEKGSRTTSHTSMVKILYNTRERGSLPPSHETVLTTCRVELIKGLKPEDIRNLLIQNKMIDYDEDTELQRLNRKKGVEYIIDIVLNSGPFGLHIFVDVLRQAGYKDLVDEIDRAKRKQFPEEINIAFVGKTGGGKSSLANTLLGREAFKCSDGPVSETKTSSVESCTKVLHKKNVKINFIDTPGLLDTNLTTYQIMQEIMKCMELAQGKIHIFVIVLKIGRMTKDEQQTIKDIEDRFGDKTESFSLLIFTHKDQLNTKIEKWIAKSPFLAEIVPKFRNRFCAIGECSNKGDDIANIFTKIVQIIEDNNYNYYDNAVFIAAGKAQEKRNEEEKKELEDKEKRKFEEFKQKYKNEMRQEIRKEIENEMRQETRKEIENEIRIERENEKSFCDFFLRLFSQQL